MNMNLFILMNTDLHNTVYMEHDLSQAVSSPGAFKDLNFFSGAHDFFFEVFLILNFLTRDFLANPEEVLAPLF